MTLALYLDEDAMDTDLVRALRLRGVDVATARELHSEGISDEQQLELASMQGRVLYSFNIKDYMPIHSRYIERGIAHAGIILAKQGQYAIGEQLRLLITLVATRSAEDMKNHVVFLSSVR